MKRIFTICLSLLALVSFGQTVNPSFNPKHYSYGRVFDHLLQPDGKIILMGRFIQFNGVNASTIIRLNADGSVDNSFSVGTGPVEGYGQKMALQPDGKILCRGEFQSFNGFAAKQLVRLNSNGSVDVTFNASAALETNFYDTGGPLLVQSDGKILTVKRYIENNVYYFDIVRLNTNGSLDNTFQARIKGSPYQISAYSGNRFLIVGSFSECNGVTANNIVLLTSTGANDNTFGTGTDNFIRAAVVQSTGKIILIGGFSTYNGGPGGGGLIRLNTNFTQDPAFQAGGSRYEDIAVDAADNVYAGRPDFSVVQKFNPDGTQIYSYETNAGKYLLLQPDGKLLVFGYSQPVDQTAFRLNTNFTVDNTFAISKGPRWYGNITASDVQPDGKIILAGDFAEFEGHVCGGIVRLNTNLTVDQTLTGTGFNVSLNQLFFDFVKCQPDGKIIVCGQNNIYNGSAISGIIRLNTDGTVDNTFIATRPFSITGAKLFEGYLYISNEFAPYLRRLFPYGTVDNTFAPAINGPVKQIDVQDEKLLTYGTFTTINGTSVPKLVRLNFNGTLDNSFVYTNTPDHTINSMQAYNAKMLLGGNLKNSVSGTFSSMLLLGKNGEPYPEFEAPPTSSLYSPRKPVVLPDRSILAITSTHLERVLPLGKRDPQFAAIALNGLYLDDITPVSATSFFYRGILSNYSDERITQVSVAPIPAPPQSPVISSIERNLIGYPVITWADNSSNEKNFIIQRAIAEGSFSTLSTLGSNQTTFEDESILENTSYRYRIVAVSDYGIAYSAPQMFTSGLITSVEGSAQSFKVYPNPSSNYVTLIFSDVRERTVKVVNPNGQVLSQVRSSDQELTFDLSHMPAGLYCLRVDDGKNLNSVKVVKY